MIGIPASEIAEPQIAESESQEQTDSGDQDMEIANANEDAQNLQR